MNMFFNLMPMPVDMSDMKRRLDILQEKYHRMNDYSYDDKLFGVVRGKIRDIESDYSPITTTDIMAMQLMNERMSELERIIDQKLRQRQVAMSGASRDQRLNTNIKTLYHQTDRPSANEILQSQNMLRGSSGLAGGGIYFAISKEDTNRKAHKKGVFLKCRVKLGNVKKISSNGDNSITFSSLQAQGYDSVEIPRPGGTEYVVYNKDQVYSIEEVY